MAEKQDFDGSGKPGLPDKTNFVVGKATPKDYLQSVFFGRFKRKLKSCLLGKILSYRVFRDGQRLCLPRRSC